MSYTTPPPDTGPRVTRENMRDISTLRRARDGRMVAGVAEGLSRHFDVDPLLIRVVLGALTLFGGAGIALYVIAWITVPEEGQNESALSRTLRRDATRVMIAGLAVAAVIAAGTMIGAVGFSAPNPFPVIVVIGLSVAAFALFSRRDRQPSPPQQMPMPFPPSSVTSVPSEASMVAGPSPDVVADAPVGQTREWWQRPVSDGGPGDPTSPPNSGYVPPPPPIRKPRSHLFGITVAVIAIALGTIWILDETTFESMPASVYPGTVLAITAAALIVGAWYGRSRLLIVVGILATLGTIATVAAGPGPYGERIYRPTSVTELRPDYDHGVGRLVLHLEDLSDPKQLDGQTIDVHARIGQIVLVVPSSMAVTISAHVDHGEIDGPARTAVTKLDAGGEEITMSSVLAAESPDLVLDVDLDFGQIQITQYDCPSKGAAARSSGLDTSNRTGDFHVAAACN
jgi:phage shock protein PspC (stress-responsive transcriptional regulator)